MAAPSGRDDDGWLAREVRRFRTYPHVDRAYRLVEAGRLEEARAELERSLAIDPGDAAARGSLLVVLARLGDHAAVVREADRVLSQDRASVHALRHRAVALEALGRRADALADLQALSRTAPDEAERRALLVSIAETARALGRDEEALAALDRLPEAARDHRTLLGRGLSLERLGRLREAGTAYAAAFARAGGVRERLSSARALAELAARRGAWADAVRWEREVLASPALSRDDRYRALLAAGHAYARLGRQPEASASFRAASALRPDFAAFIGAATALERQGLTAEAITELERAIALRPQPELQLRLGVLHVRAGQPRPARAAMEAALRGPLTPEERGQALEQLGFVCLALGDDADAAQALRSSLEQRDDAKVWRALAQVEARLGDVEAAARIHERLLADPALDAEAALDLLLELGHLQEARGLHAEAAEIFLEAADRSPEAAPGALASAAESLALAGEWREAVAVNGRLLAQARVPAAARADAFTRMATAHTRLQQPQLAADALRESIALGRDGARPRLDLAASLYAAGRWSAALEQAQASLALERSAQALLYAARCLEKLNRPGLALHHLREAAARADLDAGERGHVQRELCFLYEQQADHARAADACARALADAADPELQVRLVRLHRLSNRLDAAQASLRDLDLPALAPHLQAQALDERAELEAAQGRPAESIAALRTACALEDSAERRYRLGLRLREVGDATAGEEALAAAVRADPGADRYREALGYAQLALRHDAEAARLLEPVASGDPDYLSLPRDLGYVHLRLAQNAQAARWFTVAIDNAPLYPVRSSSEEAALERELFRLREEVTRLRNRYDLAAYATLRSPDAPGAAGAGTTGAAGLPSETGVELAWQPPVIGFRAERTVQAFVRVLGSGPPGQPATDERAAQGGLGLRWKPLRAHDLTLWGERLVRLGDRSVNDWMLRGIYSWTRGTGFDPGRRRWSYSLLQGDVARFLAARSTAVYGEARQGATFDLGQGVLLTPHAIVDGRREWAPLGANGWAEAGAGVSLKLLFRQTPHEAHRSSLELRLYHTRGRVTGPEGSRSFRGWFAITAVKL